MLVALFSTIGGEKIFCQVFDTDSDMKVHASCTRQILLQTRQTGRKNKKQSKAEIGYD